MQLATWGTFKFKADAQKCADEIMEICQELESATPQQILEKPETATLNFTSVLHGMIPKLLRNGEFQKLEQL